MHKSAVANIVTPTISPAILVKAMIAAVFDRRAS
jgi:hypothetical protein